MVFLFVVPLALAVSTIRVYPGLLRPIFVFRIVMDVNRLSSLVIEVVLLQPWHMHHGVT